MLRINKILGNISSIDISGYEKLKISRIDLEKRILRRKTDRGTDVGLSLDGVKLKHGDIIQNGDSKIVIEQLPEKVLSIKLKTNDIDVMIILGHIIGNMHRPISIQGKEILFPIQADSEKEIFVKLFSDIINHIGITIKEEMFFPHSGATYHEH